MDQKKKKAAGWKRRQRKETKLGEGPKKDGQPQRVLGREQGQCQRDRETLPALRSARGGARVAWLQGAASGKGGSSQFSTACGDRRVDSR